MPEGGEAEGEACTFSFSKLSAVYVDDSERDPPRTRRVTARALESVDVEVPEKVTESS